MNSSAQEDTGPAPGDDFPLYSVSQLAAELGLTPRALRFYEDKLLITPQRAGTTRVYTPRDRARLKLILRGKQLGFSLREIKEYLDLYDADPQHKTQIRQLQDAVRRRTAKLAAQRAAIDASLSDLEDIDRQCLEALARHG